jgi:hypothetical protein
MASKAESTGAPKAAYCRPVVEDYGTLQALTADFDLNFVGAVTKVVAFAVASMVAGGGVGDRPPATTAVDSPPDMGWTPDGTTPDAVTPGHGSPPMPDSGTLGESQSSRGGGGPGILPSSGEGLPEGGSDGGGVRDEVAGGAGLPFTGYASWAAAAVGAAMTTSGVILRDMLRRRQ